MLPCFAATSRLAYHTHCKVYDTFIGICLRGRPDLTVTLLCRNSRCPALSWDWDTARSYITALVLPKIPRRERPKLLRKTRPALSHTPNKHRQSYTFANSLA